MAAEETLSDHGSRLCLACGLCCAGALHNAASLLPEEVPVALGLGMKVTQSGQQASFALPCHLLKNRCCTVYADRPKSCRTYRCRLRQSLDAGASSIEACLDKVASARNLLRKLEDVLPQGTTLPQARASMGSNPATGTFEELEKSKIKLHAFALNVFLEKHFRNEYENSFLELISINENNG